jgi:hypothetical protein
MLFIASWAGVERRHDLSRRVGTSQCPNKFGGLRSPFRLSLLQVTYKQCDTRTKDLIDMVLLIRGDKLDKDKTVAAVRATFLKRATHDVPKELDPPPAEWEPVFGALAEECDLPMNLGGPI